MPSKKRTQRELFGPKLKHGCNINFNLQHFLRDFNRSEMEGRQEGTKQRKSPHMRSIPRTSSLTLPAHRRPETVSNELPQKTEGREHRVLNVSQRGIQGLQPGWTQPNENSRLSLLHKHRFSSNKSDREIIPSGLARPWALSHLPPSRMKVSGFLNTPTDKGYKQAQTYSHAHTAQRLVFPVLFTEPEILHKCVSSQPTLTQLPMFSVLHLSSQVILLLSPVLPVNAVASFGEALLEGSSIY